jgi:Fic/DOC family
LGCRFQLVDTEIRLRVWRRGQTIAERLCAGILRISGYTDVDPQAPLGGPDGKKDIVAWRDEKKYVAACYFPTTPVTFPKIKNKYQADLAGVAANDADGFVFFVNQMLTVGQRKNLLALGNPVSDEIFHLERISGELDSPRGYGLRLEHLQIPMSPEEQVSYFNTLEQDTLQRLIRNEPPSEVFRGRRVPAIARLDTSLLQMLHEVMFRLAEPQVAGSLSGTRKQEGYSSLLRAVTVYAASGDGGIAYMPPPPELVPSRLEDHCAWWQEAYADALTADREERMRILARLHYGIVSIMPFTDGNGRLARLVTHYAARELLGHGIAADLTTDRSAYYQALRTADGGDLSELVELIRAALT